MKAPLPPNFKPPVWATKEFRMLLIVGVLGCAVLAVLVFDIGPKLTSSRGPAGAGKPGDPNAFVPPPLGSGGDVKFEGVLQKVKDGTPIDDQDEAYQYLVRYLARADAAKVSQEAKTVDYRTFAKMPAEMRGYTVKVQALFLQSSPIRIDAAPGGVNFVHRTYLSVLSGNEGYVVDLLEPPGELEPRTPVAIEPIFLKLGTYEGRNGPVQAPLFLGKGLRLVKERMADTGLSGATTGVILGVAGGAMVLMVLLTTVMYRKSKPSPPSGPALSLETLKS